MNILERQNNKNSFLIVIALLIILAVGSVIFYTSFNNSLNEKAKLQEEIKLLKNNRGEYTVKNSVDNKKGSVKVTQIDAASLINSECKPNTIENEGPCYNFSCFCFENKNIKNELNQFVNYFKNNNYQDAKKAFNVLGQIYDNFDNLNVCHINGSCYAYFYLPITVYKIKNYEGILFYKNSGQDTFDRAMAYVYYKDGKLNILEYQLGHFLEEFENKVE